MAAIIHQQHHRHGSDDSEYSMNSHDSSQPSHGTEPGSLPSLDHRNNSVDSKFAESPYHSDLFEGQDSTGPRISVNTYCTTVVSFDETDDKEEVCVHESIRQMRTDAIPATPQEFAALFPSTRKLFIKHDDSTLDGNMNLRVDAVKGEHGRWVTLYHLRMYDLRDRDFSFRRYGRDCGREVAHIKRKFEQASPQRPALQRSVSKALHSFRGKQGVGAEHSFILNRQDSGYSSGGLDEEEYDHGFGLGEKTPATAKPTNTCTLQFSNYAHVDLARRGGKASKKYDFEYWGKNYSWKRIIKPVGAYDEETLYQLINNATHNVVACIEPDVLTPEMIQAEEAKGGFVPPCTMYLINSAHDPVTCEMADIAE